MKSKKLAKSQSRKNQQEMEAVYNSENNTVGTLKIFFCVAKEYGVSRVTDGLSAQGKQLRN